MKLYKTRRINLLEHQGIFYLIDEDWDTLINRDGLFNHLINDLVYFEKINSSDAAKQLETNLLPPIGKQEVWAAGVTYLRSMEARMEESKESGGADLYDHIYHADRPELFFKALPHRVSGHKEAVNIRRDSAWNVPEPELTLYINAGGKIQAYTVGNDMSSRSIEGENALYLPQAKIYERSAALGPCLYIPELPIDGNTLIEMTIYRNGLMAYKDSVKISRMKRTLPELAEYLYRECDFEYGSFLMTGTCLVPPNEFTLQVNDVVNISIDSIGTLTNIISYKS